MRRKADPMTARMRAAIALCAVAALVGCAPNPPVGDAKGGIIDWSATTKSQVADAASAHCARYGKMGRVTNTEADKGGGHAVFVCE